MEQLKDAIKRVMPCPQCRALPTELVAFEPWPKAAEVERCTQCKAVLSFIDKAASTDRYTVRHVIIRK